MEGKFVPAYNKYGRWIFSNKAVDEKEMNIWFEKQNISKQDLTTFIPYNCEICPSWMRNVYVRYRLWSNFSSVNTD